MSERDSERRRLLVAAVQEDWEHGAASGFARRAARRARWRNARRTFAGAALVALVAAAGIMNSRPWHGTNTRPAAPEDHPRGYEIVSDDQLLAELRDRPLLVVRHENGAREFVLLQE